MIRPERHESLDERTVAGNACLERIACFTRRELDQAAAGFAAFLFVSLTGHAKAANGVAYCRGRRDIARTQ
jgi:hypothetical protein